MPKKRKPKNVHPHRTANPALAQGLRDIAFSNKAGTHDNRPNRVRTRKTAKDAAIKINNW